MLCRRNDHSGTNPVTTGSNLYEILTLCYWRWKSALFDKFESWNFGWLYLLKGSVPALPKVDGSHMHDQASLRYVRLQVVLWNLLSLERIEPDKRF